jgi:formylglycine-generating enzyme required for sulfatase activity
VLTRLVTTALLFAVSHLAVATSTMVVIAAGDYVPQFGDSATPVHVDRYALDAYPVSNAEYLNFVQGQPKWQKSRVTPLFADQAYLAHWSADLQLGALAPQLAPVTNVSWFSAQAYCADQGKRLQSLDDGEYAAQAD